jgi:prolyl-tRNA synthetase
LVRGDHELAEAKLTAELKCDELLLADDTVIESVTGASTGFAGPIGLKAGIPLYADYAVGNLDNGVTGANKIDTHTIHVNAGRDFPGHIRYTDLRQALEGEICPRCEKGVYEKYRGIEVGQVFYLGTKYSERMKAGVLDDQGRNITLVMGCYGIGITRSMAAAIEQNHDQNGIIWPLPIAPYQVIICPVGRDEPVLKTAEKIYAELLAKNVEVILDDRAERPGVMFKDADLIGVPIRITVGRRHLDNGNLELKLRRNRESEIIALPEVIGRVSSIIKDGMNG